MSLTEADDLNQELINITRQSMKSEEDLRKEAFDIEVERWVEQYEAAPKMTVEAIYEVLGVLDEVQIKTFHKLLTRQQYRAVGIALEQWRQNYIRECAESKARGE